jgi:hypothetical protein
MWRITQCVIGAALAVIFSADPAHFALFLPADAKAPVLPKGARLTTVAEYPVPSADDLFKMAHADGSEWTWVEVQSWKKDGSIKGLLDNDPEDVPGLHSGSTVTVKEAELFDWVLHEEDGGFSGNATGELMLKRQGKTLPY